MYICSRTQGAQSPKFLETQGTIKINLYVIKMYEYNSTQKPTKQIKQ